MCGKRDFYTHVSSLPRGPWTVIQCQCMLPMCTQVRAHITHTRLKTQTESPYTDCDLFAPSLHDHPSTSVLPYSQSLPASSEAGRCVYVWWPCFKNQIGDPSSDRCVRGRRGPCVCDGAPGSSGGQDWWMSDWASCSWRGRRDGTEVLFKKPKTVFLSVLVWGIPPE